MPFTSGLKSGYPARKIGGATTALNECSEPKKPGLRRQPAYSILSGAMKIVVAPQAFKGSLSAREVAQAVATGLRRVFPNAEIVTVPVADGGEGTLAALVAATEGKVMTTRVTGPLGEQVTSHWGLSGDGETAVIEMAAASGITLVPRHRLDARLATTYGTGELIRAALDAGCSRLIVGLGGSATNDGGAGMAQALGARLSDDAGRELPFGGAALSRLEGIDIANLDKRLSRCRVIAACDVTNPLCGPEGASHVYGPQKGATPQAVEELDTALSHYAAIIARDLGVEVMDLPGSGAAGGLGAGLIAFLRAELRPGVDIVLDATSLRQHMRGAHFVFTGEGRVDSQTAHGKAVAGVALAAKSLGIPVIVIAGEIADDHRVIYECGVDVVVGITPGPVSNETAMEHAHTWVAEAAERAARLILLGLRVNPPP
jgi:glycerate kinase